MGEPSPEQNSDVQKEVRVETHWGSAHDREQVFADHLHVNRANEQFYLTFGQTQVPLVDQTEAPSAVIAAIRPVARLIVSLKSLKAMQDLLRRMIAKAGQEEVT